MRFEVLDSIEFFIKYYRVCLSILGFSAVPAILISLNDWKLHAGGLETVCWRTASRNGLLADSGL